LLVVQELSLPYGRPDLVGAHVLLDRWEERRLGGVMACTAPLPLFAAIQINALGGDATLDELLDSWPGTVARGRVRDALKGLVERGWLERDGDVHWLRARPGDGITSLAAVEAKRNNWRRAVAQAQSWEGNVDGVWLAFPQSYLRNFPRLSPLRRFGLIGVEGDTALVIRKASGRLARGLNRALMAEFLYDRWLCQSADPRSRRSKAKMEA
jgi:hypothetical protein